jgi:hypothetical protein
MFARSFVRIFIEVFNNEIGLKSETLAGTSTFGSRVMCDPFKL